MSGATPIMVRDMVAHPAIGHVDDLDHLIRLAEWNLAPWQDATGGRLLIPCPAALRPSFVSDAYVFCEPDEGMASVTTLSWDATARIGARPASGAHVIHADPYMDISATDNVNRFVADALADADKLAMEWEMSTQTLRALVNRRGTVIIGTGPQSREHREHVIQHSACPIFISGACLDRTLMDALSPGVLCIADGAGQMGAGPASRAFMVRLLSALSHGNHLVVPQELGPLARRHFGAEYPGRVHVMPVGMPHDRLWLSKRTRQQGNVLTTIALPLAVTIGGLSKTIRTLGISFDYERDPSNTTGSAGHWDIKVNTDANPSPSLLDAIALESLAAEPGSVLPSGDYRDAHYLRLSQMREELAKIGVTVIGSNGHTDAPSPEFTALIAPKTSLPRQILSRAVKALEHMERWRHDYAMTSTTLLITALAATLLSGGLSTATGLSVLAVLAAFGALLLVVAIGIGLRLHVRRWMLRFERRRRQIEARELALLNRRLAALEKPNSPSKDQPSTP